MVISDNHIHVWHVDLNNKTDATSMLQKSLSTDENHRANQFVNSALRTRFIRTRASLRNILGNYLGKQPSEIVFTYDKHGKPALQDTSAGIEFNLSYCQNICLVAVTPKQKVGIDIEQVGRCQDWDSIASYSMSQGEQQELSNYHSRIEREIAFIRGWTRKEAFTKAIGEGLLYGFSNFTVSLNEQPPKLLDAPINQKQLSNWSLMNLNVEKPFVAALAVDKKGLQLTEFNT